MANPFTGGAASFSGIDYLAPEVAQQQREILRQQAIADLLRQKSLEDDNQTQVVSGYAIPNSGVKRFSQLGQALMAGYMQRKIDDKQAAVAQQLADKFSGVSYAPASQSGSATDMLAQPGSATTAPIYDGAVSAPSYDSRKAVAPGATGGASGPSLQTAIMLAAMGLPVPPKLMEQLSGVQPQKEIVKVDTGDGIKVIAVDPITGAQTLVSQVSKGTSPDAQLSAGVSVRGQDLGAQTTQRGQNMTAATAKAGQAIDAARLGKPEFINGQDGTVYQVPGVNVPGYPPAPMGTPAGTVPAVASGMPATAGGAPFAATGGLVPVVPGKTVAAKAADEIEIANAKAKAAAAKELPDTLQTAERSINLVTALTNSPDLDKLVGNTWGQLAKLKPGTPEANLQARIDEIQGGAFLQAFQSLKGAGQITEVEGTKATAALTRMSSTQSVKEFKDAAQEYIAVIKEGMKRAKQKAGVAIEEIEDKAPPATPSSPAGITPDEQAEMEMLRAKIKEMEEQRARLGGGQ